MPTENQRIILFTMGFPESLVGKESACKKKKKKKRVCLQCRRPQFDSWVQKICWRRDRLPTPVFLGFPCGSAGKESACNEGDLDLILGLGRSPGEGKGYPLQYSGRENSIFQSMAWTIQSMGSQRVRHN